MRWFVLCSGLLSLLGASAEGSESSKRCTWSIVTIFSGCKWSCKILGHDTGVCNDEDKCFCSGDEYDFFSKAGDWISEKLSVDAIKSKMGEVYEDVKDSVDAFAGKEWLRTLTPSRCKVGNEFCRRSCHAIGRLDGSCNSDYTDCTCSEEQATLDQFTKCASSSICRLHCQSGGWSSGRCVEWDCECTNDSSLDGGFGPFGQFGPVLDPNSQVESVGKLRRSRRSFE